MASPIPIENIYYLLAYAWDRLQESEIVDVSHLERRDVGDLFAAVLINGIHHLLRRGLDQDYVTQEAEIAGIRGRVNIGVTARRMLVPHGRAYCEFDELRVDTLPNQILKAAVSKLRQAPSLDRNLREKLRGLTREMGGISDVPLTRSMFRSVQLHSNNRIYRFLLSICELICTMSLVEEAKGDFRFRDFIRDDKSMARLFESFIFNFYRRETPHLDIRKERIVWRASSADDPELRFLPTMETDISIRDRPHRNTLIIDTKFYKETFQRYFDRERLHSANLYQLHSYLRNLEYRTGPDATARGMLLYPVVDRPVRLNYELAGHELAICTVNLAEEWRAIEDELRSFVAGLGPSCGGVVGSASRRLS